MLKRIFATLVSVTVLTTVLGLQFTVQAQSPQSADMRSEVTKFGTGKSAKVHVKLRDNTKYKGYIEDASQDSFTLVDSKGPHSFSYAEVTSVSKVKGGISPLTWGIIGGAAAAAVIVGVTVIKPIVCDGGAGC